MKRCPLQLSSQTAVIALRGCQKSASASAVQRSNEDGGMYMEVTTEIERTEDKYKAKLLQHRI